MFVKLTVAPLLFEICILVNYKFIYYKIILLSSNDIEEYSSMLGGLFHA